MEMSRHGVDPKDLDEGIRDTVLLLWKNGFRTFTSCQGGRGHSFRHPTIGVVLEGSHTAFQKRLVHFLQSHRLANFTVNLVTDYTPDDPNGKRFVYLEGLDLLSEAKRSSLIEAIKRRDRRFRRQLRDLAAPATVLAVRRRRP